MFAQMACYYSRDRTLSRISAFSCATCNKLPSDWKTCWNKYLMTLLLYLTTVQLKWMQNLKRLS